VSAEDVLIIGAGANGLSTSAYLRDLGVSHRIVGRPMDSWKSHMPDGMIMRSEPYACEIAAPKSGYDPATYSKQHGLEYRDRVGPLTTAHFLAYADWWTEQLVPDVEDLTVTDISPADGGFRVSFEEADPITARQVLVATGVIPYAQLPTELSGMSKDLVTHTSEHPNLDRFRGRRVAVVGGGQSALEAAALLNETGADVQVVMRRKAVSWLDVNPDDLGLIGHVRRPVCKLCEGWKCTFWNTPMAFRRLPKDMRATKARTVLGPAGGWWLRERIEGKVDVLTEHQVRGASASGSGVRLVIDGPKRSTLDVDHIICGTGFPIDIARLPFMSEALLKGIDRFTGYPVLNRANESSVPGLYFAGGPAAVSNGPSVRFVAGTHTTARPTARAIARRAGAGGSRSAGTATRDRAAQTSH
jgi:hypothetical protein